MKCLKRFGLAAIAAGILMAFVGAGSASATELTCGSSLCSVSAPFHWESEGKTVIDAPYGTIECNVTEGFGHVIVPGSSSTTAEIEFESLSYSNCGSNLVIPLEPENLVIHTFQTTNNHDGTVTSTGLIFTVEHVGTHCIYETSSTDIGRLTGSATTGSTATLDISATLPRVAGRSGIFCGASAPLTGSFKVDTPDTLNVD